MITFFDTETTGIALLKEPHTDPRQPHIVQLGALLCDDDLNEVASLDVIIRPENWIVSDEVAAIHGITTDMAMSLGVPIKAALVILNQFIKSSCRLVAHNISFDLKITSAAFHRVTATMPDCEPFCTMQATTELCKIPNVGRRGFKWPKLSEAHQILLGEPLINAHNAMADVRGCARIYKHLLEKGLA